MSQFIFFPPASITQLGPDLFRINDTYGGAFNFNSTIAQVYLAQDPKYNPNRPNKLSIPVSEYDSIIQELINNKALYPSNALKEKPFDGEAILKQMRIAPFKKERTLSIGDVTLELTQDCPYKCEGCFREQNRQKLLPLDKIKELISDLAKMGLTKLSLSGGEITYRQESTDKAKEVIRYSRENGIRTLRLLTTGLNPSRLEDLIDSGIDEVQLSVDGTKETHNTYKKVKGAYERTIRAIDLCEQKDIKLTTNTVVTRENLFAIESMIRHLAERDIDTIRITKIITPNRSLRLTPQDAKNLYHTVSRATERYGNRIINAYSSCIDHLNCVAGIVYAHIGATGNVFPCDYVPETVAGNVNEMPFQEIWTNSDIINSFREPKKIPNHCAGCKDRVFCIGNCVIETRNLDVWEGCCYNG